MTLGDLEARWLAHAKWPDEWERLRYGPTIRAWHDAGMPWRRWTMRLDNGSEIHPPPDRDPTFVARRADWGLDDPLPSSIRVPRVLRQAAVFVDWCHEQVQGCDDYLKHGHERMRHHKAERRKALVTDPQLVVALRTVAELSDIDILSQSGTPEAVSLAEDTLAMIEASARERGCA
jgi:hypothetical protein